MKNIIIALMLLFSVGVIKANPIMTPPVISEFYLVNDSTWYIELVFNQYAFNDTTLDGYQITTSTGSAYFKNGIHVIFGNIIVITQDSMQSMLRLYRDGDYIRIAGDEIAFGNIQYSMINTPKFGQSIVRHSYSCFDTYNMQSIIGYKLVKENTPSIGVNPFQANVFMGAFSGKVLDINHNPMANIKVGNPASYYEPAGSCSVEFGCFTNTSGEYNVQVKSGKQHVRVYNITSIFLDTLINIEPDSINYVEINLDTLLNNTPLNSINKSFLLTCFPNPSNGLTTISFELPENTHYSNTLIKIYNSIGEMMRILPVEISGKQNKYTVVWDGKCYDNSIALGSYYYNLELDGKKVAANKLIITK